MYLGNFAEDATIYIPLTTNAADGSAVAPSSAFEAADFLIFKNGSATEKTTTNGISIASPFDSKTGVHVLTIDTSNDTGDSGFWVTGADYMVLLTPDETVDSKTVAAVVAVFSIQNRYIGSSLDAAGIRSAIGLASANLDTQLGAIDDFLDTEMAAVLAAVDTEVAAIKAKTDQLTFGTANRVDAQVYGMESDVITAGKIAADAIGASELSAAACAKIVGVTGTDPTGPPAVNASLLEKIDYLCAWVRNKRTQDATAEKLFADDGTTVIATRSKNDNGSTLTVGEAT